MTDFTQPPFDNGGSKSGSSEPSNDEIQKEEAKAEREANQAEREADKATSESKVNEPFNFVEWLTSHKLVVGIIAGLLVVVIVIVSVLNWQRGVRADGYEWQNNALAKYQGVQSTLSTCLDNSMQAASVAGQERQTLQDTLTKVIAARRSNSQEAIPGDASVVINVVAEQYPNVTPDLYKQLMTIVVGCRNEVNGAQRDMQSYSARFKTWTKEGNFIDGSIREQFPNDELVVDGPNGQVVTGRAALDFMAKPIITAAADDASKTKTMPEQTLFPSASPSQK